MIRREHIPNFLTLLRVVFAAGFFGALSFYRFPDTGVFWGNIAIGLFVIAAITDYLDGQLGSPLGCGLELRPHHGPVLRQGADPWRLHLPLRRPIHGGTMVRGGSPAEHGQRRLSVDGRRHPRTRTVRDQHSGSRRIKRDCIRCQVFWEVENDLQSIAIPIVLLLVVNWPSQQHDLIFWICNGLMWSTIVITIWSGMPYVIGIRSLLHQANAHD